MNVTERLDVIEARATAATEGPWRTWESAVDSDRGMAVETAWSHDEDGADTDLITDWCKAPDAEFIAHAREDVPALVAALRAVLKPEITEPPEWLGEKRTSDIEGRSPGNAEYMAYMEAVLTAAHGDDIRWGPIFLAIILDRAVRVAEDTAAIAAALDGTR